MNSVLADVIAAELPYVRRFARALTGTQERGDAYVVALLEALVADSRQLRRDLSPRTAIYQAFINVWNAMPINQQAEPVDSDTSMADKRIETITPLPRQAFLLAAVEEFTTPEIAAILNVSETEAARLIDVAGREISEQIKADVLIIEDEPLISLDIESLVTEIGHNVIGIARTRTEAGTLARKQRPGLILADIHLADGSSGIDAVSDILADVSVPIIYITAYPERLLTGESNEPAFLITKPFKTEMIKALISQALFFDLRPTMRRGDAA